MIKNVHMQVCQKFGLQILQRVHNPTRSIHRLQAENMVTCKRYPGEIYEIDDTDVFGVGDRDPIFRVFGAKDRTNNKDIRIDMQNYTSWDILPQ